MPNFTFENADSDKWNEVISNTHRGWRNNSIVSERGIRLSDRIYGTEKLNFQQLETARKHFILIQLPKNETGKINFELDKNRLVVVISPEESSHRIAQKHYAEIYLPESVKLHQALAELGKCLLIITFSKKTSLLDHAIDRLVRGKVSKVNRLGYM